MRTTTLWSRDPAAVGLPGDRRAGPGPGGAGLDELIILAPADDDEARWLPRASGARIAAVRSVLDVPAALNRMLSDPG